MIILDTNVTSELMRGRQADPAVLTWARSQRDAVTTVINRAEVLSGIAVLPEGRRKARLHEAAEAAFATLGTTLPLVPECAPEYAAIVATRRRLGRPIGAMDALIAAIARVAGASIATRNLDDFSGLDISLVDPWSGG